MISVIELADMLDPVIFGINTGCLQGEVINLRWNQIDLAKGGVILDNRAYMTKSERVRMIPLSRAVIEFLRRRREAGITEFVLTLEGKAIDPNRLNKRFNVPVLMAKLNPYFYLHNLRDTSGAEPTTEDKG